MSSTHRRKIARALAKATGMTYQQALSAVVVAAESGLLPHALDDDGITRAVDMLIDQHGSMSNVIDADAHNGLDPLGSFLIARQDRERFADLLARPDGLIVIAGATGAGKTTALYDTMTALAGYGRRVTSAESLIERRLDHPNITQCAIEKDRHSAGIEVAAAIHSVRRADPDVLVLGDEIMYPEVARAVVTAASTGTLVLSSLHATTPEAVVQRLRQLVSPALLAEALNGIVILSYTSDGRRAEVVTITDAMRDHISQPDAHHARAAGVFVGVTEPRATDVHFAARSGDPDCVALTRPTTPAHLSGHLIGHSFVTPEAGHLLITGPTGSGKTVITREVMCLHRSRGDRILLIDTSKAGADHGLAALADEVATTTDEAFAMLTRLVTDERRTLLVIEELTVAVPPPAEGERTADGTLMGMSAIEETLRRIFGDFTPERGRIIATTQRGLIADRDKNLQPLGWASGFDTNVVLGPNNFFFRSLRTPQGQEPLSRGWAYVEDEDGTLEEVNLWGEAKDRPFSEANREQVRTGLRRLAAMMSTGMNPLPALATLSQTMTGEAQRVFVRLSQASSLSAGAAAEPHVFEPWTIAMLRTGEETGALDGAVEAIVGVY